MIRPWKSWALIFCATTVAYLPALQGTLLWDDTSHVTRLDLQSLHGLWQIWFHLGATQQYYPLLHSAFWLEHKLWGDAVLGYHVVNVLEHALSACLVVLIVRRLRLPGAWIAGLLFALHPVAVESVAWISEQKSTLSGVFYLSSALVFLQFDESRRWSRYFLALGLFLLALLTKTVTATLPAALLVILWWRHGKLDWRRDIAPLAPWLVVGAAAGLFTAGVEHTYIGAQGVDFTLSPLQRFLLAGRAIWFYLSKLVLPANLAFFYARWNLDAGEWWQYLFPLGAITAAVALRRRRGLFAGYLIFAGSLFPVLGFFNVYPFRYSFVADHFQYVAMLGILVPAAVALAKWRNARWPRAIPVALLAILGAATFVQAGFYRDNETLYRASIARSPDSWLAHNNLGNTLLEAGRRDEAIAEFQSALRIKPDAAEAHLSMGNALSGDPGKLDDAIAEYRSAVRIDPGSERAHNNLGNALLRAGTVPEAVDELNAAIRIKPDYAEAHNNLGNAFSLLPGKLPDAMAEYQAAIRYDTGLPEAHNNLGRCLAQMPGRLPEAIAQFQTAIQLRPDYWSAHNNLGNALSEISDRLPDAIAEYQAAVKLAPNAANAHYNLGNALSRMPDRLPEAAAEYRAALALQPANVDAHYRLAGVLAQIPGHTGEAIAEYEKVLELRPNPEVQRMIEQLKRGR